MTFEEWHGSEAETASAILAKSAWNAALQNQWQPIETAPKGKNVFVRYTNAAGMDRIVQACFIEKYAEEAYYDSDFLDYCEADDTYYYPEGWYEVIDNWDDFGQIALNSNHIPTHWMPLPEPPK